MIAKHFLHKFLILGIILLSPLIEALAQDYLDAKDLMPPLGRLMRKWQDEEVTAALFASTADQNNIENHYRSFLEKNGFHRLKDKELRTGLTRSMRFERKDIIMDIELVAISGWGTQVNVRQYANTPGCCPGQGADIKDVFTFEGEPVSLPDLKAGESKANKLTSFVPSAPGKATDLDFEIPPPPQGAALAEPPAYFKEAFTSETIVAGYSSKLKPKDVEAFYQTWFKQQIFRSVPDKEFKVLHFRRLKFTRGQLAVEVYIYAEDAGSVVGIAKYLGPQGGLKAENDPLSLATLPKRDTPGEDLDNIPRPPRGVRVSQTEIQGKMSIQYSTPLTIAQVRDFYMSRMSQGSWKLISSVSIGEAMKRYKQVTNKELQANVNVAGPTNFNQVMSESYALDYQNSDGHARIMIYPNFIDKSGSLVTVSFKKATGKRW